MPVFFCLSQAFTLPPSAVGSMSEGGVLIKPRFICKKHSYLNKQSSAAYSASTKTFIQQSITSSTRETKKVMWSPDVLHWSVLSHMKSKNHYIYTYNKHSLRHQGRHYWLGECAPCGCKAAEETKSPSVLLYPDLSSSLHACSHYEPYRSVDLALTCRQRKCCYTYKQ